MRGGMRHLQRRRPFHHTWGLGRLKNLRSSHDHLIVGISPNQNNNERMFMISPIIPEKSL